MTKHLRVYWLTCVLMMAGFAAHATTIILPTDEQLIAKSPVIVEATVVSSVPVERNGKIWTETTLSVDKALKGGVSGQLTVREIGGAIDNRITKIFGAPVYTPGERVLTFLTPTPRGDYQTMDLYVGKFSEQRTMSGLRVWQRDDETADVSLLDSNFQPIRGRNVQRAADAFEGYVTARVANHPADANYGIENPVLQRDLAAPGTNNAAGGIAPITDNFTLISEPTVYRWFAFEQGQTVQWYSYGSQSGYSGGGVNEISTAMNAWSGYSSALIRYHYNGAGTGSGQPLNVNDNINGILFNDPYQEIAGSYNPATGGVVGVGGFNGIAPSQINWTATFTADSSHVQGAHMAYNITEAGLTIQDGVSPAAGIPSVTLAEIVAHEFGHTLGFGHSTDSTALMYPNVTGLGPTLRADDQLAARWLYPNGSTSTPPPPPPTSSVPNAPSNVTYSITGASSATLHWTDNAGSSETGETVYANFNGSAYSKVTTLAAGTTGVSLSGFSTGTYGLYVTSSNSAGESSPSNVVSITFGASAPPPAAGPTAAFSFAPQSANVGQSVVFTDRSTGASSWSWNFGDGATSTQQNPVHIYGFAGTYAIKLTVSNAGGSSSSTATITITNPAPAVPPVSVAFTFTPQSPSSGDTVSFFDQTSGSPTAWSWSFGDGATSNAQNPQHRYLAPGTYVVTLTATNSVSSSTATQSVTVQAAAAFRALVSATAQTNGVGGSVWRTELTVLNAGSDAAYGQFILIPSAGGAIQNRPLYLAPKQSVTYSNALLDIFGLSSGAGAIAIEASSAASTPVLKVTSRTFTTSSTGTYGQSVPDVTSDDLPQTIYVTGIESDASFRTNIGLVNRSSAPVGAILTLFDAVGNTIGSNTVTVPANNFQQASLATFFPATVSQPLAGLTMKVLSGAPGAISAYASVVDNRTQDPVYIQGVPPRNGSELVVPAVGRANGANGTYWRSDMTIYNPSASTLSLTLRYLAAGADDRNAQSRTVTLGAGQTAVVGDLLLNEFGLASGQGALRVNWSGTVGPVLTTRTYTTASNGGTYGQSIDPIGSFGSDSWVPGLRSDNAFRTNVGFVNGGDTPIGVSVTLLGANGNTIATAFVQVAPRSQSQSSVAALFPGIDPSSLGSFTLQAHTDSAPSLFAYGSIVDNASGDPVFYGE